MTLHLFAFIRIFSNLFASFRIYFHFLAFSFHLVKFLRIFFLFLLMSSHFLHFLLVSQHFSQTLQHFSKQKYNWKFRKKIIKYLQHVFKNTLTYTRSDDLCHVITLFLLFFFVLFCCYFGYFMRILYKFVGKFVYLFTKRYVSS